MKITKKDLEARIKYLNRLTNSPETYMTIKESGDRVINIGHYHIDCAYGGYELVRTVNNGGGVSTPLCTGHITARELYNCINAYIAGLSEQN